MGLSLDGYHPHKKPPMTLNTNETSRTCQPVRDPDSNDDQAENDWGINLWLCTRIRTQLHIQAHKHKYTPTHLPNKKLKCKKYLSANVIIHSTTSVFRKALETTVSSMWIFPPSLSLKHISVIFCILNCSNACNSSP